MIKRIVIAGVAAAVLTTGAAHASFPPRSDVRCVVTETRTRCGYFASGPGRYDAGRVGAWVVRVWRSSTLVWSTGAQTPDTGWIPAQPGDRVEAVIVESANLCMPPDDVPAPRCNGAGAIVLSENLIP